MSNFYLEFPNHVAEKNALPGPILTVHIDYLNKQHRIPLATRIWFEDELGDVYIFNHMGKNVEAKLNPAELKEFFWIKLRAHNV